MNLRRFGKFSAPTSTGSLRIEYTDALVFWAPDTAHDISNAYDHALRVCEKMNAKGICNPLDFVALVQPFRRGDVLGFYKPKA